MDTGSCLHLTGKHTTTVRNQRQKQSTAFLYRALAHVSVSQGCSPSFSASALADTQDFSQSPAVKGQRSTTTSQANKQRADYKNRDNLGPHGSYFDAISRSFGMNSSPFTTLRG